MIIRGVNLSKKYFLKNKEEIIAVDNVDLEIDNSEYFSVYGQSGSGKSTLILMLGGMLKPSNGKVFFNGVSLYDIPFSKRRKIIQKDIGFVFQKFFLIPYLNIFDNIALPLSFLEKDKKIIKKIVFDISERLNISHRLCHRPKELSVGEQQRAAMARAVVTNPKIILADEPTGNLDEANEEQLIDFLKSQNLQGKAIVVVSHSRLLRDQASKKINLINGKVAD